VNAFRALGVGAFFYFATAAAFATQPFNSCTFSVDEDGFIVVDDLVGERRFFPLATFFYPCIGPIRDDGGGGGTIDGHYMDFHGWGGNCVICPWDISHWPQYPGALFDTSATCDAHLRAAEMAYCKLIADPTLFWDDGPGFWPVSGVEISNGERQVLFGEFKTWCEASYANALLGYWQWHQPAWRYWNDGDPPYEPSASYLADAYTQVRVIDPYHGVFMGQYGAVVAHELWRDYFMASDCCASFIAPCPAPGTLNGIDNGEYYLPNHYCSVVGDLADVASEAARSHSFMLPAPAHRNQPYIAILQGHLEDENDCSAFWYNFMAYDAIIHGAKGIAWYDDIGGDEAGDWYWPAKLSFLSVMQDLDRVEDEYGLLTADYDSPLVRVITYYFGNEVERSAFVGGELVPKTHFLSSERFMEGCAKIVDGKTYLIVACRADPSENPPPPLFQVEFYPYYSAYDFEEYWAGPVYKLVLGGAPIPMTLEEGAWTDAFTPGEVNIYYFVKPAPWQPSGGVPE